MDGSSRGWRSGVQNQDGNPHSRSSHQYDSARRGSGSTRYCGRGVRATHRGQSQDRNPNYHWAPDSARRGWGSTRGRGGRPMHRGQHQDGNPNYHGASDSAGRGSGSTRGRGGRATTHRGRHQDGNPNYHGASAAFRGAGRDITKSIFRGDRDRIRIGSNKELEDIIISDFLFQEESIFYLKNHGRVMFCIRGFPGTGKGTIRKMLANTYPTAKVFCADFYYSLPFENKNRSIRKPSHIWCKNMLLEQLQNGYSPLILCNCFIREFELDFYLDEVRPYAYTIIMIDSNAYFEFNHEALVETNQQSLSEEYFKKRLTQWCDYIPWYTGWFLGPADSDQLFQYCLHSLEVISPDLRAQWNLASTETFEDYYSQVKEMFCIAVFCNAGQVPGSLEYYLSKQVEEWCGKVSSLDIVAFLVNPDLLAAVVALTPEQQQLVKEPMEHQDNLEELVGASATLSTPQREIIYKPSLPSGRSQPTFTESVDSHHLATKVVLEELSVIVLGSTQSQTFPFVKNPQSYLSLIFGCNSNLRDLLWKEHPTGSFFKLNFSQFIFVPSTALQVRSVFTGLF